MGTEENVGTLDIPIHDIKRKEESRSYLEELFQSVVNPQPTAGTRLCGLYQPDGSQQVRRLPEKLRRLPCEIRYDAKGLELCERITKLDEYYLGRCEREILRQQMPDIVKYIPDGALIVELGCGSMSKTATFLDHMRTAGRTGIKFFALDIDKSFLQASLTNLAKRQEKQDLPENSRIQYAGIYGSYTDALSSFLKEVSGRKVLLWLGTSMGNMSRDDACALVSRFQNEAMNEGDLFFVGIDKRNDPATVALAYNDAEGLNAEFELNGLDHFCRLMGIADLDRDSFDHFAGYNDVEGRHEAYVRCIENYTISVPRPGGGHQKVSFEKDELIASGVSFKYSTEELHELAFNSGLILEKIWTDAQGMFNLCMFQKPSRNNAQ